MEIEYLQNTLTKFAETHSRILQYSLTYELQIIDGVNEYNGIVLNAKDLSIEIQGELKAFCNALTDVKHEIERNSLNLAERDYLKYFEYSDSKIKDMISVVGENLFIAYINNKKTFLETMFSYYNITNHPADPVIYETYEAHKIIELREYLLEKKPSNRRPIKLPPAVIVGLFCQAMSRSEFLERGSMKIDEYCKRVCKQYGFKYSDNVRQGFSKKATRVQKNKIRTLILPNIAEDVRKKISGFLDDNIPV